MFAYCRNNPSSRLDHTGTLDIACNDDNTGFGINANDWTGSGNNIKSGSGAGIVILAPTFALPDILEQLKKALTESYAHAKTQAYKHQYEVHHVVAKGAPNAKIAADILNSTLPNGVENPLNKISIKTGLHRRLHTNFYYYIANRVVIEAYLAADTPEEQQENVITALGVLRGIIAMLNDWVPY